MERGADIDYMMDRPPKVTQLRPPAPDAPIVDSERIDDPRYAGWRPARMTDEVVEGEAIAYRAALECGITRETFFAWLVSRHYFGGWDTLRPARSKRLVGARALVHGKQ